MEVIYKLHAATALLLEEKSSVPTEQQAGFQSRSGCSGKEKYLLPPLGIEKRFLTYAARTVMSVPTVTGRHYVVVPYKNPDFKPAVINLLECLC